MHWMPGWVPGGVMYVVFNIVAFRLLEARFLDLGIYP